MNDLLIVLATIVLGPIVGGFLFGVDRKLTARLQGRYGPPLLQPFYDFIKLWSKSRIVVNQSQMMYVYGYLLFTITALCLLALRQDLLIIIFVLAFGGVSLIMGAFSVKSPYSNFGAQREILQMVAYEPILMLAAVAIYLQTGSFMVSDIFRLQQPLLFSLPLVFVALLIILTIKMRKSPFDISASAHAHQEIVRGVYTEYSGPYLALVELTHWYELLLVLGIIGLFWATSIWAALAIALAAFLLEIVVDNIEARMTWPWMIKFVWATGISLSVVNIAALYIMK
ncbi:MAG: respiratory chain complex I subunit 1 family protein [Sphingomonadaceae bacterium]